MSHIAELLSPLRRLRGVSFQAVDGHETPSKRAANAKSQRRGTPWPSQIQSATESFKDSRSCSFSPSTPNEGRKRSKAQRRATPFPSQIQSTTESFSNDSPRCMFSPSTLDEGRKRSKAQRRATPFPCQIQSTTDSFASSTQGGADDGEDADSNPQGGADNNEDTDGHHGAASPSASAVSVGTQTYFRSRDASIELQVRRDMAALRAERKLRGRAAEVKCMSSVVHTLSKVVSKTHEGHVQFRDASDDDDDEEEDDTNNAGDPQRRRWQHDLADLTVALCPFFDGCDLALQNRVLGPVQLAFLVATGGILPIACASAIDAVVPVCPLAEAGGKACTLAHTVPAGIVHTALASLVGSMMPFLVGNWLQLWHCFPTVKRDRLPWWGLWLSLSGPMAVLAPVLLFVPLASLAQAAALLSMLLSSRLTLDDQPDANASVAPLYLLARNASVLLSGATSGWLTLMRLSLLGEADPEIGCAV